GGETVWIDWDHKKYEYLTQVRWEKYGPLTITVQDRLRKALVLLTVDPKTGKTAPLLGEDDSAWVNLHQDVPRWSEDGKKFVWITEQKDGPRLEVRGLDGTVSVRAGPKLGGLRLLHFNPTNQDVIFLAGNDPTQSQLFHQRPVDKFMNAFMDQKGLSNLA